MGFESLEIIIAIEDEFGILIPDSDVWKFKTPNDIVDYIYSIVSSSQKDICNTQHAFYTIRTCLLKLTPLPRSKIRPDLDLFPLIDKEEHFSFFENLRTCSSPRSWFAYEYSFMFKLIKYSLSNSLGIIAGLVIYFWNNHSLSILGYIFGLLLGLYIFAGLDPKFNRYRTKVPKRYFLIRNLVAHYAIPESIKVLSYDSISIKIKRIVMDVLNLNDTQFNPNSRFKEEYGI
jgi:hypothetical protein